MRYIRLLCRENFRNGAAAVTRTLNWPGSDLPLLVQTWLAATWSLWRHLHDSMNIHTDDRSVGFQWLIGVPWLVQASGMIAFIGVLHSTHAVTLDQNTTQRAVGIFRRQRDHRRIIDWLQTLLEKHGRRSSSMTQWHRSIGPGCTNFPSLGILFSDGGWRFKSLKKSGISSLQKQTQPTHSWRLE